MKLTFTSCLFMAVFCSCNTYHYITVSSADMPKNSWGRFVSENDTMKLVYDFSGEDGPVQITVFNKLDKPLMLDLNRSVVIINGNAIGLNSGRVEVNSSISSFASTVAGTSAVSTSGSVGASTTLPQGQLFIPSGTYARQSTTMYLSNRALAFIPADRFAREAARRGDSSIVMVKAAHFTTETSPLAFRTFLTFVEPGSERATIVRQHSFYVSDVQQTKRKPARMGYNWASEGNEYYVMSVSKTGRHPGYLIMASALATAGIVLMAAGSR